MLVQGGKYLCNADTFSLAADYLPEDLVLTSLGESHIKEWAAKDLILSCVLRFVLSGWPYTSLGEECKPYVSRKSELVNGAK